MHWNTNDLVDAIAAGLQKAAQAADLEHAISSLDARNELGLHPLIHRALAVAGYGVWPEVRYPADRQDRRRNRGRRCDVVLTPDHRPLGVEAETMPSLFEGAGAVAEPASSFHVAEAATEPLSRFQKTDAATDTSPVALSDAYWLEIKTARVSPSRTI